MRTAKLTQAAKTIVFIFAFSVFAFAAGLPEYRAKIEIVRAELDNLRHHDEAETIDQIRAEERESLAKVRTTLLPSETVELQGSKYEADHNWLFAKLKIFETEPDLTKRQAILAETVERLEAVENKLTELERQEASLRTKDADKQKLDEILRRPEYQKPEVKNENFLQKAWRAFWEWLDSLFPKSAPKPIQDGNAARPLSLILQLLIYGVVLGAIGFLLYRFAPFLKQRFFNREKREKRERVILGERLAEDETSDNLFSEAERLAREGNLRAAIRKGYIALLCDLSDRKIIGLARHKTNRDYLRDVRKRPELHQNMNALTGTFERVWYGFGKTETPDWESFREKYNETIRRN
jgi:Domain of unknown function (DUF4129)